MSITDFVSKTAGNRQYNSISIFVLALFNTPLSLFISLGLLLRSGETGFVEVFQFISHFLAINLAVCLLLFLVTLPLRRALKYAGPLAYLLLQLFLFVDVKIYENFHFHFNLPLWREILTEGFSDSVTIGSSSFIYLFMIAAAILVVEVAFTMLASKAAAVLRGRTAVVLFAVCLIAVGIDKVVYAFGHMYNVQSITRATLLYPLYQPLKADKTFSRIFGIKVNPDDTLKMAAHGSLLNYPRNALIPGKSALENRPNVIVLVVEGFRYDMLTPEVVPNLWKFSRENVTFRNHYSGGNGTRMGVFSLLYGLQGTYWHSFLIERKSPVLIDALNDLGYDFKVLSSTKLTYPEFRKTAFVKIPSAVEDDLPGKDTPEKDRLMVTKFIDFLATRKPSGPFFASMFFNSSHQPYVYPSEFEKFTPVSAGQINYVKGTDNANMAPVMNRYKNSLYFNDSLFGKLFEALGKNNLLQNSIVVITGDHGEAFGEQGDFGHTGSFDDPVAKVVFVMHMPGVGNAEVDRITSHHDFVPTVMKALGFENPVSDYSQGSSLFDRDSHPYVFSAGWDRLCMIDDKVKIVFSTETYRNLMEVHNTNDYKPVPDPGAVLTEKRKQMADVLRKMSEFYR